MDLNKNPLHPTDFTDAGNATVFVREYREDLIYTNSMGWLCWDGKRWEQNEHKALELAEDFSERMLNEARKSVREAKYRIADLEAAAEEGAKDENALSDAKKAEKSASEYLKHALITRRSARLKAILDLSRPFMVLPGNAMDSNPCELNTQAGIIHLVTGNWRTNQREARCTKITALPRSKEGEQLWQDFLHTITCEDSTLEDFLQLVIGMALFGKVYQEGVTFCLGGGKNGKSTFFNAVGAVLGDYAGYIDIDVITTRNSNDKAALATLRGKWLVIAGELEEGRRLSAATIKKISSTDPFQVEEKYKQPEIITPSHTLCLFTNHLPRVGSTDVGTWRRIIVIPFNAVISGDSTIHNYADHLVKHAGGAILAWAVEGAQRFARCGFRLEVPDSVKEATAAYRERENWLENFVDERCIRDPNSRIGARELYQAYKEWSGLIGEYIRSEKEFSVEMERAGFQSVSPKRKKHYIGLELIEVRVPGTYCGAEDLIL